METELLIPRVVCGSCCHSHAFLPDVLIPFSSYSLRFILTVLVEYLGRSCTVAALCEKWQLAISTLYSWIHLFLDHFNAFFDILDHILWITEEALTAVMDYEQFPAVFFARFGFSFLQLRQKRRPPD